MDEKKINKIMNYLNKLGQVRFYEHDFETTQFPVYASIELITDIEMAIGLEETINNEISILENKNPCAKIKFIGISEQKENKIRYTAEIIPTPKKNRYTDSEYPDKKHTESEYLALATERFLILLSKAFRNIRQKRIDYRKIGEEILEDN